MAALDSSLSLMLVLLLLCGLFVLGLTQSGSGCNLSDCLMSCPDGQYYNNELAQDSSDCCELCNINNTDISSGSGFNCMSCDSSCESCYGPQSTQCYKCYGPFIRLYSRIEDGTIVCEEDGLLRDTSLDVVQCVDNCTNGFILNDMTTECVCGNQFYRNGSSCEECISFCEYCVNGTQAGCLQCGGVQYEGQCLGACPNNTFNVNRVCLPPSTSKLKLSVTAIIGIIAAIGAAILIFSLLMTIVVCVCACKWKSRRYELYSEDPTSVGGTVTVSESFKKVTRNISLNKYKRTVRPAEGYENVEMRSGNPLFMHNVRQSYDPYYHQHDTAIENINAQDNNDNELNDRTNMTTNHSTASNLRDEHSDSVYVEMTPGTSIENMEEVAHESLISKPKPYRKVKLSQSFPGLPRSQPLTSPQFTTLPKHDDDDDDDEIEHYVDPNELKEEYVDPKDLKPQDYIYPSQFIDKPPNYENVVYGNTGVDEEREEEQEFYVDLSGDFNGPPIPSRAIHPSSHVEHFNPIPIPPRRSRGESLTSPPPDPDTRRDTLDNQYVVIQKPARKQLKSSGDILEEHSYVNVSHDNSRLRSITSPEIKPVPPKKARGGLPEQDSLEEVYI